MLEDKQARRRAQIRSAAYSLLEKKGYKGTSMLAIARQARASNETLYAWYGSKQNLFRTLVEENAREVADALAAALENTAPIKQTLERIGALLLTLVTGEKAIALTRAAAADASESGQLGEALASAGRDTITPLLQAVFDQAKRNGQLAFKPGDQVLEVYIGLLLGDSQVRRATGAMPLMDQKTIDARSRRACRLFLRLFG